MKIGFCYIGSILADSFGMLRKRAELQGWIGRYYSGLAVYLFHKNERGGLK